MFITPLDLLYLVLAFILFPIGILISMVLWRIYSMFDRIERILDIADRLTGYIQEFEKIPTMIIEKFIKK